MSERTVIDPMSNSVSGVGALLRQWRAVRRVSQMDLALNANISTRHLSFVETGRSKASRSVVLRIADALDMSLREKNTLLNAAGFARVYAETSLDDPEFAPVRRVLEFLLERHEPYSAIVIDPLWNVLMANQPHYAFLDHFLPGTSELPPEITGNLLRLLFHPLGLRPAVVNWEELAGSLLLRFRREVASRPGPQAKALLEELTSYPDVPHAWSRMDPLRPVELLAPLHLRSAMLDLRLISTFTVFGTPQDVTLEEIRIETFFPADDETHETITQLANRSDSDAVSPMRCD